MSHLLYLLKQLLRLTQILQPYKNSLITLIKQILRHFYNPLTESRIYCYKATDRLQLRNYKIERQFAAQGRRRATLKYRSSHARRENYRRPLWRIQVLIKLHCLAELAFLNLYCRIAADTIAMPSLKSVGLVSVKPPWIARCPSADPMKQCHVFIFRFTNIVHTVHHLFHCGQN